MYRAGRITEKQNVGIERWDPKQTLDSVDQSEVRFSRGFLRCEPAVWFDSIGVHWISLLHAVGTDISIRSIETGLLYPAGLERIVTVDCDGETALLGWEKPAKELISQAVFRGNRESAGDVVIEYIERRLISTLVQSWNQESVLKCSYVSSRQAPDVEISGTIRVEMEISSEPCSLWFGLGPRMVGRFDQLWRERCHNEDGISLQEETLATEHSLSVELVELAVPPAMLIDYMRSGTTIDLETPIDTRVLLKVDGEPWLEGNLCRVENRMAVRIVDSRPRRQQFPENTTRVSVELVRMKLDRQSLLEHAQPGAVLLTNAELNSEASMVISGENVANASIGVIDDRFALSILPK